MAINRRQFLKGAVIAGAGLAMPTMPFKWIVRGAHAFSQSPTIHKFVTGLPGLTPAGANNIGQYIPVASPTTQKFAGLTTDVYHLTVRQYREVMHPDLPNGTRFWGYSDFNGDQNSQGNQNQGTPVNKYLGPAVVATRGRPVLFYVTNGLPNRPIVPVDPTIMAGPNGLMVGNLPFNRIVTHLHGGLTPLVQ